MRIERTNRVDSMGLIKKMGEEWFEATGFEGEMDWGHMVRQTNQILDLGGYFALAYDGETVAGGLLGLASPDPFTGKLAAHEMAWYIDPEHRRGGAAAALLRDFESWAKDAGCKQVHMIALTTSPKGLDGFFGSQGYKPVETRWGKSL